METILEQTENDTMLNSLKKSDIISSKLKSLRWVILFISCFMIFGDYYAYDTPYAVKLYLRQEYPDYSNSDFNYLFATLYSVYDFPNIILPLINNYLGYKFGNRRMMTVFLVFILVGTCIVSFGVELSKFWLMILGRIIYGIGGDSLLVSQWAYILEYFHGDRVGLASGILQMFTGISESANLYFSPRIVEGFGLSKAFIFTSFLCILAFIARISLTFMERGIKDHISKNPQNIQQEENQRLLPSREDLRFSKSFYTVLWACILTSVGYYGYYYLATDFLTETWFKNLDPNEAQKQASLYTSFSSMVKTVGYIALGYIADKYKIYTSMAIAAPIFLTLAYLSSLFMQPVVPFLLLGIGGALSQISLWTCLALAVEEKKILVSAAVMYSLQNALFAVVIYTNTLFYEINNSYNLAIYCFVFLNVLGLIGAVKLHFSTRKNTQTGEVQDDDSHYIPA